jgi:23S rRNA (guanine2445-N2)-methyltransferase / 23S rRNA (guanine2069-N7)-methyltransferase
MRKNLRRLRGWLKQAGVTCYRLYDADLPDYAASVDVYGDWVQVKEYERPDDVPPIQAEGRLHGLVTAVQEVLGISADQVFVKQRMRQRGSSQYGRLSDSQEMRVVEEGGLKFWTNPVDYLDTGLFLDHRPMRALLGKRAQGRRFLNLFCYTGAATVHAAAGGAVESVSVDLSGRYLNWLLENLVLNGLEGPQHGVVREDVMLWLRHAGQRFDLIFVDPPTFSNSKDVREDFDVQRDHVAMLQECVRLLLPGGEIFFSNNFRRFKLDHEGLGGLQVEEISASTIPPDFARSPRIHRVWRLTR